MARVNYRQIGGPDGLLAKHQPFEGNSMSAIRYEHNGKYVVYSYSTIIAEAMPGQGITYLNDRRYSRTTNRHQGLVRAWLN